MKNSVERPRGCPKNLRSLAAVTNYPGSVYFEGTNLTEGRGTDRPFEQIGASWLNAPEVARVMNGKGLPGIRFEPITMRKREAGTGSTDWGGLGGYPQIQSRRRAGVRANRGGAALRRLADGHDTRGHSGDPGENGHVRADRSAVEQANDGHYQRRAEFMGVTRPVGDDRSEYVGRPGHDDAVDVERHDVCLPQGDEHQERPEALERYEDDARE